MFAVVLLAVAVACAAARADGDPASDVLLNDDVFFPYTPPVSPSIRRALNAAAAAGCRAQFAIKVALIASPADLGALPSPFGKPQKYADYLEEEISFGGHQPLLVVMASGYGTAGLNPRAKRAVVSLDKPESGRSNDLARAATSAIVKLEAADGHAVTSSPDVPCSIRESQYNYTNLIWILVGLAAIAIYTTVLVRRTRSPEAS